MKYLKLLSFWLSIKEVICADIFAWNFWENSTSSGPVTISPDPGNKYKQELEN